MSEYVILDIDGTISDDTWRQPYLPEQVGRPRDYDKYHDHHTFDEPHRGIIDIVQSIVSHNNCELIVMTARHRKNKQTTLYQLNQWGIIPDKIFMRPNDDNWPSHNLKTNWMKELQLDSDNIYMAFDDNTHVLQYCFWRSGILAARCCRGEIIELKKG